MDIILPSSYIFLPIFENPSIAKYEYDISMMDAEIHTFINNNIGGTTQNLLSRYEDFIGCIKEQDEITEPLLQCINQNYIEQPKEAFTLEEVSKKTGALDISESTYEFYKQAADERIYPIYATFMYAWIRSMLAASTKESLEGNQFLISDMRTYVYAIQFAEKRHIKKIELSRICSSMGIKGTKVKVDKGRETQDKVLEKWNKLNTEKRNRAGIIAKNIGLSSKQVRKHLEKLEEAGKIKRK